MGEVKGDRGRYADEGIPRQVTARDSWPLANRGHDLGLRLALAARGDRGSSALLSRSGEVRWQGRIRVGGGRPMAMANGQRATGGNAAGNEGRPRGGRRRRGAIAWHKRR